MSGTDHLARPARPVQVRILNWRGWDILGDFAANPVALGAATVFALILLRIPTEHTVTEALNKHSKAVTWRGRVARYFGRVWINPLDLKSLAEGKQHIEIKEEPSG